MKHPEIPSFAYRLFRWFCSDSLFEELEGDLEESFLVNKEKYGLKKARSIYTKEILKMIRPSIIKKISGTQKLNHYGMFKTNLKIAFRNLIKQKEYTLINLLGLSTSLAVSMLIILFLIDQDRMDEHNPNSSRIYRVLTEYNDLAKERERAYATSPFEFEQLLPYNVSEVDESSQIIKASGNVQFDESSFSFSGLYVSPNFLSFFDFPLEKGNTKNALDNSNGVVLSKVLAAKLFREEDPIGKLVVINDLGSFSVTGIVDSKKVKSHLDFDLLIPKHAYEGQELNKAVMEDWVSGSRKFYNYIKLEQGASIEGVTNFFRSLEFKIPEEEKPLYDFSLQRLDNINLGRLVGNEIGTTSPGFVFYFFLVLALVLMLSSSFNYMNLSIARGLKRAKEVGVRKIIGAKKRHVFFQFLLEAQLLMFVSFLAAFALLQILVPLFNSLKILRDIDGAITMNFNTNLSVYLVFFFFTFGVGLIAGIYPAAYLSSFRPLKVLKGIGNTGKKPSFLFRKILVFFQYSFSIIFIITTIILYQQAKIFTTMDYGFNHRKVLNVAIPASDISYQSFRNELLKRSEIEGVSAISSLPIVSQFREVTVNRKSQNEAEAEIKATTLSIDPYVIDNLELTLLAGNNFRDDQTQGIIINQKTLHALGYSSPQEAINNSLEIREVRAGEETITKSNIIGVVQDFSYEFVFKESGPLIMRYDPTEFSMINIRVGNTSTARAAEVIEDIWDEFDGVHPFEYESYEYTIAEIDDEFTDLVNIVGLVAFIAILIACLGQFSMVVHHIQLRVKEVGIRKVLGSNSSSLIFLLSKDFLIIILLAVLLATPLAWKINLLWTSKIFVGAQVSLFYISLGVAIILLLAFTTIFILVKKAAGANPVDSIGYE